MSAHRSLQASNPTGLTPVASVPGGGPYDLTAALDKLVSDQGVDPSILPLLPEVIRNQIRNLVLADLLENGSDIRFQATFLDEYLAGDRADLDRYSNVYNWKPDIPVRLYHGEDDETVPYVSATDTLAAMQALGADVALETCPATPSTHLACVPYYWQYMLNYFNGQAQDL
jgi:fermentation-respiration switch protein FrsA (DUF1100 family)